MLKRTIRKLVRVLPGATRDPWQRRSSQADESKAGGVVSTIADIRDEAHQPRRRGRAFAEDAIQRLTLALGPDRVSPSDEVVERHGVSTTGVRRSIAAAVRVRSTDEVRTVLQIARQTRVPVYPVSTGHNWGYGSANPVVDGSIVLDLSGMDEILGFDAQLGTVTLQPGVTQAALHAYLEERDLPFMVPTHGGGPNCSIVGNALERGYGITPTFDHFQAVRRLEAVLPDGSIYSSPLSGLGARRVDEAFKWGIGPYLDGIFSQGGFGVVTEMTIALSRRPEAVEAYFFFMKDDEQLEEAVAAVHEVLERYPGVAGPINLMNDRRILSMVAPYPIAEVTADQAMSSELVQKLSAAHGIPAWTGLGALYGRRRVVAAVRREIKVVLRRCANRVVFLNRRKSALLRTALDLLPLRIEFLETLSDKASTVLDLLEGRPSQVALPLAYWRSGARPHNADRIDPARDGCGLIWYAPLVPVDAAATRRYVEIVNRVCLAHGIEPLITLTAISSGCFDSTIPILFDRRSVGSAERARRCFEELLEAGRRCGFFPYRLGVDSMDRAIDENDTYWRLVGDLKSAVDPDHIVAPGRYAPLRPAAPVEDSAIVFEGAARQSLFFAG